MDKEMMKTRIQQIVRNHHGGISFPQLQNALGNEAFGQISIYVKDDPNHVLWMGVSEAFLEAFLEIQDSFCYEGPVPRVYLIEGKALNLPIAHKLPGFHYQTPHWLPVLIHWDKSVSTGVS